MAVSAARNAQLPRYVENRSSPARSAPTWPRCCPPSARSGLSARSRVRGRTRVAAAGRVLGCEHV